MIYFFYTVVNHLENDDKTALKLVTSIHDGRYYVSSSGFLPENAHAF